MCRVVASTIDNAVPRTGCYGRLYRIHVDLLQCMCNIDLRTYLGSLLESTTGTYTTVDTMVDLTYMYNVGTSASLILLHVHVGFFSS